MKNCDAAAMIQFTWRRHGASFLLLLTLILSAGCGAPPGAKLLAVQGVVTVGGQTPSGGLVTFYPDGARGNKATIYPTGGIRADGTYVMSTSDKEGAVAGWYKVTVSPGAADDPRNPTPQKRPPAPMPINPRYSSATSTDLAVEVVENSPSGAYDLKLAK